MSRYAEFDLDQIRPHSVHSRGSKVQAGMFARPPHSGASFADFLASLPHILAGDSLRRVAAGIVEARRRDRAVIVSCGGHVVKCGLSPMLIGLMERGLITALAINGAVAIHDLEIALFHKTSEDVEIGLQNGTFGTSIETAGCFNAAIARAQQEDLGAGEALGKMLQDRDSPCGALSLLAQGYRLQIPVTVHIAIGTDIVHMHPSADGAALGSASLRDFRILTEAMRSLADGGVLLNIGSAVVLPEVLLKAMALLRNQDAGFSGFMGVDMDFVNGHRAYQQLVRRVEAIGGEGICLTGHHEIMIPLLTFAVLETLEQS